MRTLIAAVGLAGIIGFNAWATKHNSPQHVWLFCDMLGWCSR